MHEIKPYVSTADTHYVAITKESAKTDNPQVTLPHKLDLLSGLNAELANSIWQYFTNNLDKLESSRTTNSWRTKQNWKEPILKGRLAVPLHPEDHSKIKKALAEATKDLPRHERMDSTHTLKIESNHGKGGKWISDFILVGISRYSIYIKYSAVGTPIYRNIYDDSIIPENTISEQGLYPVYSIPYSINEENISNFSEIMASEEKDSKTFPHNLNDDELAHAQQVIYTLDQKITSFLQSSNKLSHSEIKRMDPILAQPKDVTITFSSFMRAKNHLAKSKAFRKAHYLRYLTSTLMMQPDETADQLMDRMSYLGDQINALKFPGITFSLPVEFLRVLKQSKRFPIAVGRIFKACDKCGHCCITTKAMIEKINDEIKAQDRTSERLDLIITRKINEHHASSATHVKQRQRRCTHHNQRHAKLMIANAKSIRPQRYNNRKKKNIPRCIFCHKLGHNESQCWKKHPNLRLTRNQRYQPNRQNDDKYSSSQQLSKLTHQNLQLTQQMSELKKQINSLIERQQNNV